ncbi:pirin family protein [Acinetobacter wuhouensis]|uniref:Pirin family protein n=1 Tax=Acinetobacter wuhouensis TaxID=1879050 RepID=A0A385BZM0_9GAMM|nr:MULTISPECIES: pirin family protein [Acinetobacter]AXQ20869.1 pirin family protein [Acinetobacter wuhouensis]AYO55935.1 pirin family protein [Acinetobacter wuhouensis]RZG48346.1 pirin family protein [Acinetobacter wuhouensis]RZG74535.1 pirin family protein [Acinetobacter wuhouensis]RZG86551.1 pirin family protein [Acinetobacter sp. WCHAc060033]
MKKVVGVYRNQQMHWVGDGFPVKNLFSYDRLGQTISPFLLLDYAAPYHFDPTTAQHGVGSHPHRGFETVTIAYKGEVTHKDSHGGGGTIKTGDVQWMTAGSGLVHEEFHSSEFAEQGGLFEMVQLWVNLPASDKMTAPKYQAIEAIQIPVIKFDDEAGYLRVIAGEYAEQQGPANTFSPINVWDVVLKAGHQAHFHVPIDHTSLIVLLEGELLLNGTQQVLDHSVVIFGKDGEAHVQVEAVQNAKFLVLTGKPLNEPIQGYGPFVMNSKDEIIQAFDDFNNGKFGEIAVEVE